MTYLTNRSLSRRTVLKGMGVTVALPLLEAMVPASRVLASAVKPTPRLIAIEMVHGAAGSSAYGIKRNLWSPAVTGRGFDLAGTALSSLEPFRDYLTIVSNTDCRNAEAFSPPEIGADHFRSSAVFLTQSKPKQTQGSDVFVGTSFDQIVAKRFGQETPIPSMQLCIENIDQAGGCSYNYSCVYTDSVSWASPTQPLPMIRDPRVVFDQLFGVGATPEARLTRRARDRSILDWIAEATNDLKSSLGAADRARLSEYLDDVREIERRIQKIEAQNTSGEPRELPEAPIGVPDSYDEHEKLMLDLQAVALASDVTRVFAFKMSRDVSNRVFPESGSKAAFHTRSHHQEKVEQIEDYQKINRYHVSLVPYLLDKLKKTPDGDATLLDNTLVLYGSPMGDSNLHNHKRCPLFFAGRAGGRLKGNLHVHAADGTPMANAMLSALHALGADDMEQFGDSTGSLDLTSAVETTVAARGDR